LPELLQADHALDERLISPVTKRALRRAVACLTPAVPTDGVRILLYHAVGDSDPADRLSLSVSREAFRVQMRMLGDYGYAVVPLTDVLDPRSDGRERVAITFDDGYTSQRWAADTLRRHGFPATFFLVPRFLDGMRAPSTYWERWDHLRWEEVHSLAGDSLDIGAHSVTHPDLRTCGTRQIDEEISGAKQCLEDSLQREIVSFSYPYGRHDARVRAAVERAGYRLACSSRYGTATADRGRYALPRIEVSGADSHTDFLWKLRGKYDWVAYWQSLTGRA
jgi:peptidoglycan/xylan/chitin deacetylase (PgdA/CDA1 family)